VGRQLPDNYRKSSAGKAWLPVAGLRGETSREERGGRGGRGGKVNVKV